ncbi:MAG: ABC-2 transporter permease [Romboutsia sp.]
MKNIINLVKMNYSNLNAVKKMIILPLVIFVPVSVINPMFLNMLIGVIFFNITQTVIAYEDSYGIDTLIGYLPVKRSEYVISRYVSGILNIGIATCIFIICYYLADKYSTDNWTLLPYGITLGIAITAAITGLAIIIPCILKFGAVKGRTIVTLLMIIVLMIPAILSQVLVENKILESVLIKLNTLSMPLIFVGINIIILTVSYMITQRLYVKKEI